MNKHNAYVLTRAAKDLDAHVKTLRAGAGPVTPAMNGYLFGLETAAGILRTMAADMRKGDR